jgi:hypothetical protein
VEMETTMKRAGAFAFALAILAGLTQSASAQWVRTYHAPVVVSSQPVFAAPPQTVFMAPPQPVFVSPAPVTRVYRPVTVMYQPTTVVTTRNRPILGGTVVRTRPGVRRVIY